MLVNDFVGGDGLKIARYHKRLQRRLIFYVDNIEPRSKKTMPQADQNVFQTEILKRLRSLKRRQFRGPIALSLNLFTFAPKPDDSHHIAKNLLDLLGKPLQQLQAGRKRLLYNDDNQINALSVVSHPGTSGPAIYIEARPLVDLMEDLSVLNDFDEFIEDDDDRDYGGVQEDIVLDNYRYFRDNELRLRQQYGVGYDDIYDAAKRSAQEELLGDLRIRIRDLIIFYNVRAKANKLYGIPDVGSGMWETMFAATRLRITLDELPQAPGTSDVYRAHIETEVRNLQKRYGDILQPLLVPVAIEVLVKPPHIRRGLHDLDNIMRTYLLPRILEILKPTPDYSFKVPKAATPAKATKVGVTRFEAWRLAPAEAGEKGFVSVALVADRAGLDSVFRKIDEGLERWEESIAEQ